MSTRRPILFPAICLALAVFCAATAQPLQPEGDNEFGGTPGMHLFLQSRFIRTHQADRLHFARMRHYREGYLDAVGHGEYARALAFSDSLIRTAEHHPVAGVHFTDCYKERADMFRRLHRDSEARIRIKGIPKPFRIGCVVSFFSLIYNLTNGEIQEIITY